MRGELGPLAQAVAKYQIERRIQTEMDKLKGMEEKLKKIQTEIKPEDENVSRISYIEFDSLIDVLRLNQVRRIITHIREYNLEFNFIPFQFFNLTCLVIYVNLRSSAEVKSFLKIQAVRSALLLTNASISLDRLQ